MEFSLRQSRGRNIAAYLIPVCADIHQLDPSFVPGEDMVMKRPARKGWRNSAYAGSLPAIANAVWHAMGRRVHDLPITPDKLFRA